MRKATTAKVCLDLAKSARFTVPVPSTVGFDRLLLTLSTIVPLPNSVNGTILAPKTAGNLTNVGPDLFFKTVIEKYSGWH